MKQTLVLQPILSLISKKELTKEEIREIVAKRAAKEFKEGDVVTLGIGFAYGCSKLCAGEHACYIPVRKRAFGSWQRSVKRQYR